MRQLGPASKMQWDNPPDVRPPSLPRLSPPSSPTSVYLLIYAGRNQVHHFYFRTFSLPSMTEDQSDYETFNQRANLQYTVNGHFRDPRCQI